MSYNTQKPTRLLKAIEDQIQFLIPTAVITHAYDPTAGVTLNDEYLSIAFSGQTHLVCIRHEAAPASGATDGLGLTQRVYTPNAIYVGIDSTVGLADADTALANAFISAVCASKGLRFVWGYKAGILITDLVDSDTDMKVNFSPAYDGTGYLGNQ